MKKIINGKKYDTETAKKIGFSTNNLPYSDFTYCDETLYRKKTGEFFLYGEGGAMSKYSQPCGQNCRCGGSEIIPMTEEEAKKWTEKNLNTDEYEEIFGEVEE